MACGKEAAGERVVTLLIWAGACRRGGHSALLRTAQSRALAPGILVCSNCWAASSQLSKRQKVDFSDLV